MKESNYVVDVCQFCQDPILHTSKLEVLKIRLCNSLSSYVENKEKMSMNTCVLYTEFCIRAMQSSKHSNKQWLQVVKLVRYSGRGEGGMALFQKIAFGGKGGVGKRINLGQLGAYKSLNLEPQDSDITAGFLLLDTPTFTYQKSSSKLDRLWIVSWFAIYIQLQVQLNCTGEYLRGGPGSLSSCLRPTNWTV